jgi:hypothetical protein
LRRRGGRRHIRRRRWRRTGLLQRRLLLDWDTVEHRAVFINEAMHRLHTLIMAFEVVVHLLRRIFMQRLTFCYSEMLRGVEPL